MDNNNNYIEVSILIPDSFQSALFKTSNEEYWKEHNWKRKELQKDVCIIAGRPTKTVKEWFYWDREEIIYLVTHAYYTPKIIIAENLNRTVSAVKHKLKDIKENPAKYDWILKELP